MITSEVEPMATKKYYEVKAYLEPSKDKELIATLTRISESSGMSMSAVMGLILRAGVGNVEVGISSALKNKKPAKVQTSKSRAVKR
jgi:hypothetical protein